MAREESTPIDQKQRSTSFLQYFIHLFPLCAVITIISLNFSGLYVGNNSEWLPILQFVAKLLEITMQTSIIKIVSSYLQYEISNRTIPLGTLFAALQVTTLSYLWSLEFRGALKSPSMSKNRKLLFVVSVVFGMLLAAAVGPSSAIALIPRGDTFSVGSTTVWINLTTTQVFPSNFDRTMVPTHCTMATSQPFLGNDCPFSEWQAIAALLDTSPGYTLDRWDTFQTSDTTRNLQLDTTQDGSVNSAFVTVPQAPVAEAMQNVADLWWTAVSSIHSKTSLGRFKTTSNYIHTMDTSQSYVIARCIQPILSSGRVSFPNRIESRGPDGSRWTNTSIPIDSISNLFLGNQTSYKVHWIELPQDQFSNISIGAVIIPPDTTGGNDSEQIQPLACSLYAGYGGASLNLTLLGSEIISSRILGKKSTNDFLWSLKRVNITRDWASSLTVPVDGQNTTVDSAIYATMNDVLSPDEQDPDHPAYFHEALLASLVANGLGRSGFSGRIIGFGASNSSFALSDKVNRAWISGSNHNVFGVSDADTRGMYQLAIDSRVSGLSYSFDGAPIKIAIVFLLIYCSLELLYLVYVMKWGFHLPFWDTVAGLTIVALGSSKSASCYLASAGSSHMGIFKKAVQLRMERQGAVQILLEGESDLSGI